MEHIIEEKKLLFSNVNNNFLQLLQNISKIDEKKLNERMIYQFKYIIEDIKRLNENIEDMNNNIIYNNFDNNKKLKEKIEENENVNKIIQDLMPLYFLKSMVGKNT